MSYFIVGDRGAGTAPKFHQTPYKSGTSVELFDDAQTAQAAIQKLPAGDNWQVEEVKDLLAWYSLLAQSGVTHVCEVTTEDGAQPAQNIHMLISNLRISGTIDSF